MADPTIQTFCCHHRTKADAAFHLMQVFDRESYLIISIISSTIGILGSVYQIFIRKNYREGSSSRSVVGRKIIVYLAICDLCACFGVCVRSALWSAFTKIMPYDDDSRSVLFCSISSAFIQLFYTATWLWTYIYAYNMKKSLQNQPIRERNYHIFVWSMSILLTSIGTTSLYYPNADCRSIDGFSMAIFRVMPNYFFNYGPILFVMIANPILYLQCSKEVDRQLIQRFGQYTNNERQIHDLFKIKFSLINIIFYVCWLPNIINAILVWTMWYQITRYSAVGTVVVINWYVIAILNPLQAFFNAFIYRKWNEGLFSWTSLRNWITRKFKKEESFTYTRVVISENSPLLTAGPSRNQTQTRSDAEEVDYFHRHSIQCQLI